MTKIYEALENAGQEKAGYGPALPSISGELKRIPKPLEGKLMTLLQRVDSAFDTEQGKVVLFAGLEANNHASRVLCSFATLAAMRMNRKVLLVAASPFSHACRAFNLSGAKSWDQLLAEDAPMEEFYVPVPGSSLAISLMTQSDDALPGVLSSTKFREWIGKMMVKFDIILLDAPSFQNSTDGALLGSIADGVVLVVEAGKTRWQAARSAIEHIEAQRGTVIGVILNRRRYYIPNLLYKRF